MCRLLFLSFYTLSYIYSLNHLAYGDSMLVKQIKVPKIGILPWIKGGDPIVALHINNYLYLDLLHFPAPVDSYHFTEWKRRIVLEDNMPEFNFKIGYQNEYFLSLIINKFSCGASCSEAINNYIFNIKNGQLVMLSDLFTPSGAVTIAHKLSNIRIDRVKNKIVHLRKKIVQTSVNQFNNEENDDVILLREYEACIAQLSVINSGHASLAPDLESFQINQTGISFIRDRCIKSTAIRELDELNDHINHLKWDDLKEYMTPYGRSLLLGEGKAIQPIRFWDTLLHGTIGQMEVTVVLKNLIESQSVIGVYYYDKYRNPIELNGKIKEDTIQLNEKDKKNQNIKQNNPVWNIKQQGDVIKGEWYQNQKNAIINLEVLQ